jgi:hypothetical protein
MANAATNPVAWTHTKEVAMARIKLPLKVVRVPTPESRATLIKAKFDDLDKAVENGTIPSARLNLATLPTANDTVTIGGHVFKFVAALAAAAAFTQVKVLGTAALDRAALVKAINGTADANVVPAIVPHAVPVIADEIDATRIRIRKADVKGGTPTPTAKAGANIAVAEGLTAGADVWDRANLNESGQANVGAVAISSVVITAAMITAGKVYVELPFTPIDFVFNAKSAAGVPRLITDNIVIEGDAIKIPLAGGAAPAIQPTDIVTVSAVG